MTNVTKTYLPPIDEYIKLLEMIWDTNQVTNGGDMTVALKNKLQGYLDVANLELTSNGTLALGLAIRALALTGEIITTPYTYVATSDAIMWEGCTPIFVDIDEQSLCINPELIESAITEKTTGILATHVYGYPCNTDEIGRIAKKHNLKVIYDAAHCFGVRLNGKSLVQSGDACALSFHATKLFHTVEGGAVVSHSDAVLEKVSLLKMFGHIGEDNYIMLGTNAKISELHAAMGLCVLPKIDEIIRARRGLAQIYDELLVGADIRLPRIEANIEHNYSYYPVIFPSHDAMMRVRKSLMREEIYPRRYFYPSLNTLGYLTRGKNYICAVSESISSRVLCLPMYAGLTRDEVFAVAGVIKENL